MSPLCAGIAQLVERNLAKVEVAGSNPVSRSTSQSGWWQSGHAVDCNSAHAGSIFARVSNAPLKQILATADSTDSPVKVP